ncbi:hypothetical protein MHYMCMPSP_00170 [Hyalomma marginatum]|uniref:Uncharacterized protein n=1 Tax=Hyalomma marginatum TaxID=34627 RepID=A0A8S4BVR0_9ACAR|nr:hypothetical protein MHYMCMPSP_00170 [Hyalomma marginatum]CAG7596059.1 hypothetical protein MHYMCMPASI_00855 [Hyalomma marginatum]
MSKQGAYPVISFSLKEVDDLSLQTMIRQLKIQIRDTFMSYHYLRYSNKLNEDQKEIFHLYLNKHTIEDDDINTSIHFLSEMLAFTLRPKSLYLNR